MRELDALESEMQKSAHKQYRRIFVVNSLVTGHIVQAGFLILVAILFPHGCRW